MEELALLISSRSVGRPPSSDNVAQVPSDTRWFHEDAIVTPPPKIPKTHDFDGNSFCAEQERRLCEALNTGACVFNQQSSVCPKDGSLVHHGAHACLRTDFPASRLVVGGVRGKSKGFGKGRTTFVHWQALGSV